ncbi:MAG: hypothetical protein IID42_03310 [Planctomycetes bacterium]|nr:hypothetical protein [Planctomycetota bacterium]
MNKWISRNAETILIVAAGALILLYAGAIPLNKGSWPQGVLFAVVAFPAWFVFIKALLPLVRRMDAKLNAAKGSAKFLPLAGCVGVGVILLWMLSLIGTVAGLLGGPKFSGGICHYLTSFSWMHVVVGIGATLPFFAAAGVCHVVRWRSRRETNKTSAQVSLSR